MRELAETVFVLVLYLAGSAVFVAFAAMLVAMVVLMLGDEFCVSRQGRKEAGRE